MLGTWGLEEGPDAFPGRGEDIIRKALRQLDCAGELVIRQAIEGDDLTPRVHRANLCCNRWTCAFCAGQLAAKKAQAYAPRLAEIRFGADDRCCQFVTLTVRDGEDLAETFGRLEAAFGRLHKRYENARRRKERNTLSRLIAMLGQFELKRGAGSGRWHPHLHAVFVTQGRIDRAEFQTIWGECVGDRSAWCKVQFLASEWDLINKRLPHDLDALREAFTRDLIEVIKYPVKIDGNESRDPWEAFLTMGRKRMVRTWGDIRYQSFDELTDEPLDWDAVDYLDWLWEWDGERYDESAYREPGHHQEFDDWSSGEARHDTERSEGRKD